MSSYDLYGFSSDDIDAAKHLLEISLGVKLWARNSSYHGEYFQWGKKTDEHFVLKRNVDPFDHEPAETAFTKYKVIFYINDTSRSVDLHERIKEVRGFVLLRHKDLE